MQSSCQSSAQAWLMKARAHRLANFTMKRRIDVPAQPCSGSSATSWAGAFLSPGHTFYIRLAARERLYDVFSAAFLDSFAMARQRQLSDSLYALKSLADTDPKGGPRL